jgi:hypothetical protein
LGDLCLIDILVENGSLERVVARHASPKLGDLASQLRDHFPPDPQGQHPRVQVIRTGKSMWSSDMTGEHLDLVTRLGCTSYMSVPLTPPGGSWAR